MSNHIRSAFIPTTNCIIAATNIYSDEGDILKCNFKMHAAYCLCPQFVLLAICLAHVTVVIHNLSLIPTLLLKFLAQLSHVILMPKSCYFPASEWKGEWAHQIPKIPLSSFNCSSHVIFMQKSRGERSPNFQNIPLLLPFCLYISLSF